MKRALLISLSDWAATFAVGALGFLVFGERAAPWVILAAVCSGATVRLLVEHAVSRLAERRAFVLRYLRERGEASGLAMVKASGGLLRRGTCYTHLDRLEEQGLIWSARGAEERRLYRLTGAGVAAAEKGRGT